MKRLGLRAANVCGAIALVLAVLHLGHAAFGQSREMHSSLAGQLRMFQLRVVSGRITASGPASHQNLTSNCLGNQRREHLSIDLGGGQPDVTYERTAPDERLSCEIEDGSKVTIQLVPRSASERATVIFHQPNEGSLTLTVATDQGSHIYHAPTLWQLLIFEPEVCREHLVPLLELLRPSWQLGSQAQEIEKTLCQERVVKEGIDHAGWQSYIRALASARFVERERAEQQLIECGPIIVPYLRSQERSALDAEQAFRMRRIIRTLAAEVDEDTPERVAVALAGDPRVWYSLLARDDVAVRRTAGQRLGKLLAAEIEFHPDGTPEQRTEELARLAERFGATLNPPPPFMPEQKSE